MTNLENIDLEIVNFLAENGLFPAQRLPLPGDASNRRYERIIYNNQSYMLMIAPPEKEDIRPFVKVDKILRNCGLNAPNIIEHDDELGFVLMQDFGDDLYSKVLREGANELKLYKQATEILELLPQEADLPEYSTQKLLDETALLTDWLLTEADRQEYLAIWAEILAQLDNSKKVLVMRDYHADNLLWLPNEVEDIKKVGLLDFQDAVIGHPAYDLVSLLEDARRDVSAATVKKILKGKSEEFMRDYYILGAQRNCKIIGIFNRLKKRDGKDSYMKYLPRVWAHLQGDLKHPSLARLKKWIENNAKNN